jgi:hypothetical protein
MDCLKRPLVEGDAFVRIAAERFGKFEEAVARKVNAGCRATGGDADPPRAL